MYNANTTPTTAYTYACVCIKAFNISLRYPYSNYMKLFKASFTGAYAKQISNSLLR